MDNPLLHIVAGQAHILVEVEAPDAARIELPIIGCRCKVFIDTRGRVPRGKAQNRFVFLLERLADFFMTTPAAISLMCSKSRAT